MNMSQKWVIDRGALRAAPNGGRLLDIPAGTIVTPTGNEQTLTVSGRQTMWAEIAFNGRNGWVNAAYLEDYLEKFASEVTIAAPTPDPNDAAQYIFVEGHVKHNLCGEFCVAFIVGDSIDNALAKWKQALPDAYRKTIGGQADNPTGIGTLEGILNLYGFSRQQGHIFDFKTGLTDPLIGYQPSPGRFAKMLQTHALIAGVNIDSGTGRLRGSGVGHWVVLDKVTPVGKNGGNGGWAELYNPFPNRREEYSYDEFTSSCGGVDNWNGAWVQRKIISDP
jgi:hypothetical protein